MLTIREASWREIAAHIVQMQIKPNPFAVQTSCRKDAAACSVAIADHTQQFTQCLLNVIDIISIIRLSYEPSAHALNNASLPDSMLT